MREKNSTLEQIAYLWDVTTTEQVRGQPQPYKTGSLAQEEQNKREGKQKNNLTLTFVTSKGSISINFMKKKTARTQLKQKNLLTKQIKITIDGGK